MKQIIYPVKISRTEDRMIIDCDIGNNKTKKVDVKPYSQAWHFFLGKTDNKKVEVCFEELNKYQEWIVSAFNIEV